MIVCVRTRVHVWHDNKRPPCGCKRSGGSTRFIILLRTMHFFTMYLRLEASLFPAYSSRHFPLVCGVCDCALHNMHSCFVLLRNSVCCAQSSMRSALGPETCCAFCLRSAHVRTLPPGNKSARRNDASTSEMRACTAGTKNVVRVRMCWWWWANVRMRGDVMTVGN